MALLFAASGWTQEALANKEGKSQSWIDYRLRFGAFLNFTTAVVNSDNVLNDLSEWKFRKYWESTNKALDDRIRFKQVYELIQAAGVLREAAIPVRRNNRPKIGNRCRFAFPTRLRHDSARFPQKPRRSTRRNRGETMSYNLVEAGAAVGKTKSTILKAIRRGVISANRDETTGGWAIDPAELHRVFPLVSKETTGNHSATTETAEIRELRARLDDAHATITDLRRRLDAEAEERRRLTLMLADQRPGRRAWWPWRRG